MIKISSGIQLLVVRSSCTYVLQKNEKLYETPYVINEKTKRERCVYCANECDVKCRPSRILNRRHYPRVTKMSVGYRKIGLLTKIISLQCIIFIKKIQKNRKMKKRWQLKIMKLPAKVRRLNSMICRKYGITGVAKGRAAPPLNPPPQHATK